MFVRACSKDSSRSQLPAVSVVSFCFKPPSRTTPVRNFTVLSGRRIKEVTACATINWQTRKTCSTEATNYSPTLKLPRRHRTAHKPNNSPSTSMSRTHRRHQQEPREPRSPPVHTLHRRRDQGTDGLHLPAPRSPQRLLQTHGCSRNSTDDGTLDAFPSDDERISGPYTGYDKYGTIDHIYWMYADCGEATRKGALIDCC
jgi:hypothetical protein